MVRANQIEVNKTSHARSPLDWGIFPHPPVYDTAADL